MNNEYLIFAINEIRKALDNKQDEIYIGYDDFSEKSIGFNISVKAWNEYLVVLKEFAIEEECYEHCQEITTLQEEVKEYVADYFMRNASLTNSPKS